MILYDTDSILSHSPMYGAYLTLMGDKRHHARPLIVNHLSSCCREFESNYEMAYYNFVTNPLCEFQLIDFFRPTNFFRPQSERIQNAPTHVFAIWYDTISKTQDALNKVIANSIMAFFSRYNMPLYIPYQIDTKISNEIWDGIILPTIVELYSNHPNKNAIILPPIINDC